MSWDFLTTKPNQEPNSIAPPPPNSWQRHGLTFNKFPTFSDATLTISNATSTISDATSTISDATSTISDAIPRFYNPVVEFDILRHFSTNNKINDIEWSCQEEIKWSDRRSDRSDHKTWSLNIVEKCFVTLILMWKEETLNCTWIIWDHGTLSSDWTCRQRPWQSTCRSPWQLQLTKQTKKGFEPCMCIFLWIKKLGRVFVLVLSRLLSSRYGMEHNSKTKKIMLRFGK